MIADKGTLFIEMFCDSRSLVMLLYHTCALYDVTEKRFLGTPEHMRPFVELGVDYFALAVHHHCYYRDNAYEMSLHPWLSACIIDAIAVISGQPVEGNVMPHNSVIFLNGTSSAGKTSIARALLDITALPYIHFSVDQLIMAIPKRYWANSDADARNTTFANAVSGYHHCVATLAATGNYVIADHVLLEPEWWAECGRLLSPFQTYLITVFCPLDELERREKARGDREIGLARSQYDRVYGRDIQDFKVDTSLNSASMCAVRIQEHIESGIRPSAFQRIGAEGTR